MHGIRKGNRKSHGMRCYASGGRVANDIGEPGDTMGSMSSIVEEDDMMVEGVPARARMDRASPRKQAPVAVNVVVNSGKSANDSPPAPMAPPMPMQQRKNGGRVNKQVDPGGVGKSVRGMASKVKRIMDQDVGDLDPGEKRGSMKNFGKDILRLAPNSKTKK